jgi:peptidoglycan-N-acetylglucosamine deacetylase
MLKLHFQRYLIVIILLSPSFFACEKEELSNSGFDENSSLNKMDTVKEIVITIDDAPAFPENTEKMLDILALHKTSATFFCIGHYLEKFPELASRIAQEQVMANHTYTHLHLSDYKIEDLLEKEITYNQKLIDSINLANDKKINRYFRVPYSAITDSQKIYLTDLGYQIIWWGMSADDWDNNISVESIKEYYLKALDNAIGVPVVLFHLSDNSVIALDWLLSELNKRNINVITLDEKYKIN